MTVANAATPPLRTGERRVVRITDIAFGGEGVARVEDFVVFVPFVAPGEEVEVELTEVKRQFARARLLRVTQPSPERVQPACRHFAACGGCQYQHLRYETQLALKHKQLCDLFQRIGRVDASRIAPVIPCPAPYGYRNRIMIRSQWNKPEQRLNIGFVRHDCGLVEDIFECRIAEPALSAQIAHVRDHPPPKGGLKVVLRIPPEDWEVPRDSFFQNNFFLLPALVDTARAMLADSGARHLIDAYCGVGFFAIELAGAVESWRGVEIDVQAIHAARRNATRHGAANGEFVAGSTDDLLPDLLKDFPAAKTAVLIDPPRKGCRPQALQILRDTRPGQILYVSCHPATLARDLNLLCADGGYRIERVVPLDMFPQTQHVECIADLRAGEARAEACPPGKAE
jgi:tRNA/tmRNA/rRNA uracil-C5-methylase (TrmA/RlmC/RlmD family)